jgi:hypothetical protein
MVYLGQAKSGGIGDIQKCNIESNFLIPIHWEFVAKTQKDETKVVQKM